MNAYNTCRCNYVGMIQNWHLIQILEKKDLKKRQSSNQNSKSHFQKD